MIRLAKNSDLDDIMVITKEILEDLKKDNNDQWNENYPSIETFNEDIKSETLYVYENDEKICGFLCLNETEADEYKQLKWHSYERHIVLHRMAVAIGQRRKGIALKLIDFAEQYAKKNGVYYIRTDTYSINDKMISLFKKCRYEFCGNINIEQRSRPLNCYDKILE